MAIDERPMPSQNEPPTTSMATSGAEASDDHPYKAGNDDQRAPPVPAAEADTPCPAPPRPRSRL